MSEDRYGDHFVVEPSKGDKFRLWPCFDCGAFVAMPSEHDRFHARIKEYGR